jgi:flavin-dependent dehydrogenase
MSKITILGAGISGLVSAINLAQNGYRVKVFERGGDCGTRFRGDLQGLENWSSEIDVCKELESFGLEPGFDCSPIRSVKFTNTKEEIDLRSRKPFLYLVKRGVMKGTIDQALKAQALKNGVEIAFNAKAREEDADIVATGPKTKETIGIDRGIVFSTEMPDTAAVIVNDEMAYKGYSYLLVVNGYGCMCTVVFQKLGMIKHCFENTKREFGKMFDLDIREPRGVGGISSFSLQNRFEMGGRLYVGEAAGVQDALWGFGIRSAAASGHLAANSIIKNLDYQKLAEKRFKNQLTASIVNRFLWTRISKDNYSAFFSRFRKAKDHREVLSKLYGFGNIKRLLMPSALSSMRELYPNLKI